MQDQLIMTEYELADDSAPECIYYVCMHALVSML